MSDTKPGENRLNASKEDERLQRIDRELVRLVSDRASSLVLVHQMGKVGSSSIAKSLEQAGVATLHTHYLGEKYLASIEAANTRIGMEIPKHCLVARWINEHLIPQQRSMRMITMTREPIARNISAFFQNLAVFRQPGYVPDPEKVQDLIEQFLKDYSHDVPLEWFDREIKGVFGVDVYLHAFPSESGYCVIKEANLHLLIMKAEASDETKIKAITQFLGIEGFVLVRENVGAEKQYKNAYLRFKELIRVPADYIEKMYSSRYARHFYSDDELKKFRSAWSQRRSIG